MSKLHEAMVQAITANNASTQEIAIRLSALEATNEMVILPIMESSAEEVISESTNSRTGVTTRKFCDLVDYVERDEAIQFLQGFARLSYSMEACCASLIANYMANDRRVIHSAAGEHKTWKPIVKDMLESYGLTEAKLPSQWNVYLTKVKQCIALGMNQEALLTMDESDDGTCTKRVATRYALDLYIKANRLKTERLSDSERVAKVITDIASSDDGFLAESVELPSSAKNALLELAVANCHRSDIARAIQYEDETPAEAIRNLIDNGHVDLMREMLAAHDAANQTRAVKVA